MDHLKICGMNATTSNYDSKFFDELDQTSRRSARLIVPRVLQIVSPESVIDIGCGRGAWIAEFQRCGVQSIVGVDSTLVDTNQLAFERSNFIALDLSKPFSIESKFDLAVCLEVGEHLPAQMARHLVQQLTIMSPLVLFSAAIPGQGGTRHINEQWHWYWHKLFSDRNYDCFDLIRPGIFAEQKIAWWFRQNIFMYAERGSQHAEALKTALPARHCDLSPVADHIMIDYMTLPGLLRNVRQAIMRAMKNRMVEFFAR